MSTTIVAREVKKSFSIGRGSKRRVADVLRGVSLRVESGGDGGHCGAQRIGEVDAAVLPVRIGGGASRLAGFPALYLPASRGLCWRPLAEPDEPWEDLRRREGTGGSSSR